METTVTIQRVKAKLSCNHTVDVASGQPIGAQVDCEKCPAKKGGDAPTRRIKRFVGEATAQPEPTPAVEVEAAEDRIAELVEQARSAPEAPEAPEAEVISLHGGAVQAPATDVESYSAAKVEWEALKAWRANGQQGPKPETPNLDATNEAYDSGAPRKAKKAKGATRSKSVLSPKVKAAKDSGKRGKGKTMNEEELISYVIEQRRQYPEETSYNLKEYSWWVEGNAHGLKRWNDAWAAASDRMVTGEA
jgi:hypothetical protein